MRYSAEDLMNDSWVISGPLITGQSYFSNANVKSILSKNISSRNKIDNPAKRPNTTVNINYLSQARKPQITLSHDQIATMTHYTGFGNAFLKRSIDANMNDSK